MDIYDVIAVVGIGLVGAGCWLIAPALAYIAVGALLIVAAAAGARRQGGGR